MRALRTTLMLAAAGFGLAGCVTYPDGTVGPAPAGPVYGAPDHAPPPPVYVPPPPVYVPPPVVVAPRPYWGPRPYYRPYPRPYYRY